MPLGVSDAMAKGMATKKSSLPRKGIARPRQNRDLSLTGLNASPIRPSSETDIGTPRTPKRVFEDVAGESESSGPDTMPMSRGKGNRAASLGHTPATEKTIKRVKHTDDSEQGQAGGAATPKRNKKKGKATDINELTAHTRTTCGPPNVIMQDDDEKVRIPGGMYESEADCLHQRQAMNEYLDAAEEDMVCAAMARPAYLSQEALNALGLPVSQRKKDTAKRVMNGGERSNVRAVPIKSCITVGTGPVAEACSTHQNAVSLTLFLVGRPITFMTLPWTVRPTM